ncbi:MAG: S-layer homology domain-containing protein [Lachnospirales bacterium]
MKKFLALSLSAMVLLTTKEIVTYGTINSENSSVLSGTVNENETVVDQSAIIIAATEGGFKDAIRDYSAYIKLDIPYASIREVEAYLESYFSTLDITTVESYSANSEYMAENVKAFTDAYIASYKDTFMLRFMSAGDEETNITTMGQSFGAMYSRSMAMRDYAVRRQMNATRAFAEFDLNNNINDMLDLEDLDTKVASAFTNSFEQAFKDAYNSVYLTAFNAERTMDVNYLSLYLNPINFIYTDYKQEVVSGGINSSTLPAIMLESEANAFYDDVFLAVTKDYRKVQPTKDGMKLITNPYGLTVYNDIEGKEPMEVNMHKPLDIKFSSIDNDRAGIYKYKNENWVYQYTEFDKDMLKHTIKDDVFRGGIYALLIDNSYKIVKDINLSWAYRELYTYLRRGYALPNSSNMYNPTGDITREEFAYLIYKNLNNGFYTKSAKEFDDGWDFGSYKDAIYFCYDKGYMGEVNPNEFNPKGTLTYEQAENIMKRVVGNGFTYNTISYSMKNDKYKKSKILNGITTNIPRDEAVYMFYYLYK